jgi:histidyl-tRNA synthetase
VTKLRFVESAAAAPATAGAYVLWLRLDASVTARAGRREAILGAGDYLYCGSARGPGGLAARLARHWRKEKRAHWHVDQLTKTAEILGAFVVEGGDECVLNAKLARLPVPLPGFGSSDCPRCASHLRAFPAAAPLPSAWENARKTAKSRRPNKGRRSQTSADVERREDDEG